MSAILDKGAYLKQLTSMVRVRSRQVGLELEGSTPPSVFIGSWNYPKVYAGPMLCAEHGDTSVMDSPEQWIPDGIGQGEIIDFRMGLVRGKHQVSVKDVENRMVGKLTDVALAKDSVEGHVSFDRPPSGTSFNAHSTPHGPSAQIRRLEVDNTRWERDLERAHYDNDLKARDAVTMLHEKGTPFSRIQKALSVGAMGGKKRRRLVPTRWSITACDTMLADHLLEQVRHYDVLDTFRVHEFASLNNYYAVILTPTAWQYEWMEAFLNVLGSERLIFSDHEGNRGKRGYSRVGGCYYSCKFGVLEALAKQGIQAGAIILREAYRDYVPMGVFNVRENVRNAMTQDPTEHESLTDALSFVGNRLRLTESDFIRESTLLQESLRGTQTTIGQFT